MKILVSVGGAMLVGAVLGVMVPEQPKSALLTVFVSLVMAAVALAWAPDS